MGATKNLVRATYGSETRNFEVKVELRLLKCDVGEDY